MSKVFKTGIVAVAAGFIAGILLAPKSGKATRTDLKKKAKDLTHEAEDAASDLASVAKRSAKTATTGAKEVAEEVKEFSEAVAKDAKTAGKRVAKTATTTVKAVKVEATKKPVAKKSAK